MPKPITAYAENPTFATGLRKAYERFGFYVFAAHAPCPHELPATVHVPAVGPLRIERPLTKREEGIVRKWMAEHLDDSSNAAPYLYRASAD